MPLPLHNGFKDVGEREKGQTDFGLIARDAMTARERYEQKGKVYGYLTRVRAPSLRRRT